MSRRTHRGLRGPSWKASHRAALGLGAADPGAQRGAHGACHARGHRAGAPYRRVDHAVPAVRPQSTRCAAAGSLFRRAGIPLSVGSGKPGRHQNQDVWGEMKMLAACRAPARRRSRVERPRRGHARRGAASEWKMWAHSILQWRISAARPERPRRTTLGRPSHSIGFLRRP